MADDTRTSGRPLKTSWPRCVICGTEDGIVTGKCKTPDRYRLDRFGVYGVGCKTCYNRLLSREKDGHPVEPWVRRRPYTPRRTNKPVEAPP